MAGASWPTVAWAGLLLGWTAAFGLGGCRAGAGDACLADSDCERGLVCSLRSRFVEGKRYDEKWGTCIADPDEDGVASDGDFSGSSVDNRCGVFAFADPQTGAERVIDAKTADCDDNCIDVQNKTAWKRFACFARDDCCPISDQERAEAGEFDLCQDVTEAEDSCFACQAGDSGSPAFCFLTFEQGYHLDENGCPHCRPPSDPMPCEWDQDCEEDARLPAPACSGRWVCNQNHNEGFCEYRPKLVEVLDEDGYLAYFQLDSDWDGLGDPCDNCGSVPNGIECENPSLAFRCDVNGDGVATPEELALGNQKNRDGDRWGDACDLCPDLADANNDDQDEDGLAAPCDPDDDGDGICDPDQADAECTGRDNCPYQPNPGQEDFDADGIGDLCDEDKDGDRVLEDGDRSGVVGDHPCRPQDCVDGDCRACDDNCPDNPNGFGCQDPQKQLRCDGNGDGIVTQDEIARSGQLDTDEDGRGDACDPG